MDGLVDLPAILDNTKLLIDWLLSQQQRFDDLMWATYPLLMLAVTGIGAIAYLQRARRRPRRRRRRR